MNEMTVIIILLGLLVGRFVVAPALEEISYWLMTRKADRIVREMAAEDAARLKALESAVQAVWETGETPTTVKVNSLTRLGSPTYGTRFLSDVNPVVIYQSAFGTLRVERDDSVPVDEYVVEAKG